MRRINADQSVKTHLIGVIRVLLSASFWPTRGGPFAAQAQRRQSQGVWLMLEKLARVLPSLIELVVSLPDEPAVKASQLD